MKHAIAALCTLAITATTAQSQFTPTGAMDSTLVGITTVYLTPGGSALDSATAREFALELRKAGIRIVQGDQRADAQVFVTVNRIERALSTDGTVTIEVHQPVRLLRTDQRIQIPTWISQRVGRNIVWTTWGVQAIKEARDDLLNRWLSANGR